jgi:hypothetical protein
MSSQSSPIRNELHALVNRARNPRRVLRVIAPFREIRWAVLFALLSWISSSPSLAQDVSREQMRGLDEQVQEIKSDVLGIAAELSRLEERLLYPSSTQVAVFVSLAEGETFRLDSVQIQIDGEPVARHIYSFNELEALKKGGVQRIYTGNVVSGEHQLGVSISGKLPSGTDFSDSESFEFRKDVEPKLIGITLAGKDSGDGSIRLGGW